MKKCIPLLLGLLMMLSGAAAAMDCSHRSIRPHTACTRIVVPEPQFKLPVFPETSCHAQPVFPKAATHPHVYPETVCDQRPVIPEPISKAFVYPETSCYLPPVFPQRLYQRPIFPEVACVTAVRQGNGRTSPCPTPRDRNR